MDEKSFVAALGLMATAIWFGQLIVDKIENSEWRNQLRQASEAVDRKKEADRANKLAAAKELPKTKAR